MPAAVRTGSAVRLRLRITNEGAERIVLELLGREIVFDFVVTDGAGQEVWRRLDELPVQAILRLEPLDPGETLELVDSWPGRTAEGGLVEPGVYSVRAVLPVSGREPFRVGPVAIEIRARPVSIQDPRRPGPAVDVISARPSSP